MSGCIAYRGRKWIRNRDRDRRRDQMLWEMGIRVAVRKPSRHVRKRSLNAVKRQNAKDRWMLLVEGLGNRCLRCGRTDIPLTKDHIVPRSCGGGNGLDNLQPLCSPCNVKKGSALDGLPSRLVAASGG